MTEILFEYVRQGQYVKVTAIETETMTEVCAVVPANLPEEQMKIHALKKLQYVLNKMERE